MDLALKWPWFHAETACAKNKSEMKEEEKILGLHYLSFLNNHNNKY